MAGWLAGRFGGQSYIADLFANFTRQYFFASLVALAALVLLRNGWGVVAGLVAVAVTGLPLLSHVPLIVPPPMAGSIKIISANVFTANTDHQRLLDLIEAEQPDLIALMEVNARWMAALQPLIRDWPHHISRSREDNFGIALFSKLPLDRPRIETRGPSGVPSIFATVGSSGQTFELVVTHPLPPISRRRFTERNDQLAAIAAHLNLMPGPAVLVGDLNVVPWAQVFKQFERDSRMRSARYDVSPTWPARMPAALRIPIDHCLVRGFRVHECEVGPDIGSDHLPLIVTLTRMTE